MSNTEFVETQRRLLNILDVGPYMTNEQLERALDGLMGATRQMVRTRQSENGTGRAIMRVLPRTVTPERPRSPIGPPPMRTARQFVEIREFPRAVAQLRPAATRVAPSGLIREMRATLAATTAANEVWPEDWETYPNLNKVRAIGRVKFNADCKEACGICLDTHKKRESVTTECGHEYCKQCWFSWMSNTTGNQKCPTCRKCHPKTTTFKLMADRKKRQEGPQPMQIF